MLAGLAACRTREVERAACSLAACRAREVESLVYSLAVGRVRKAERLAGHPADNRVRETVSPAVGSPRVVPSPVISPLSMWTPWTARNP